MKTSTWHWRQCALLALTASAVLSSAAWAGPDMTHGEVRKIDKEAGKLTIKHDEIKSLDMPAMTMVFHVKDRAMLDTLRPGAKIRFKAAQEAGKVIVTEIEAAP
jgi:Cu(I)/Ag(I) efflux system periplasmic protein CusF